MFLACLYDFCFFVTFPREQVLIGLDSSCFYLILLLCVFIEVKSSCVLCTLMERHFAHVFRLDRVI